MLRQREKEMRLLSDDGAGCEVWNKVRSTEIGLRRRTVVRQASPGDE